MRLVPLVIFVVSISIGSVASLLAYRSAEDLQEVRFHIFADNVVQAINLRLKQHISLLDATLAYFRASGGVPPRVEFARFVNDLGIGDDYDGIRGIGYAAWVPAGDAKTTKDQLMRDYGMDRAPWPETSLANRAVVELLEPSNERNVTALGYDMFTEPTRRAAMVAATEAKDGRLSAPVYLSPTGDTVLSDDSGFLIYLPYFRQAPGADEEKLQGFVYAAFRTSDLVQAAVSTIARLLVSIEVMDIGPNDQPHLLFRSSTLDWEHRPELSAGRTLDMLGRKWEINVYASPVFEGDGPLKLAIFVGAVSLVLATALAMAANSQIKAAESARNLAAISEQSLVQKELMLQEMKHRIKNSIARILTIARQTGANSDSVADMTERLTARLQAMASAQDMLTRDHWQRADLRALLDAELEQVIGSDDERLKLKGPPVNLDERAAQSLGLCIHELATNAMKYGALRKEDGTLAVSWVLDAKKGLVVTWTERPGAEAPPGKNGFGTRLIDASVRGELGGSVSRSFGKEALVIEITVPRDRFMLQGETISARNLASRSQTG